MTDILVCCPPDRLLHKQGRLENDDDHSPTGDYYWELRCHPKQMNIGDRLYFATQRIVRGYFVIVGFDGMAGNELLFNSSSWVDVAPVKIKPSQGFRYFSYPATPTPSS
jgi:hypothetical protein